MHKELAINRQFRGVAVDPGMTLIAQGLNCQLGLAQARAADHELHVALNNEALCVSDASDRTCFDGLLKAFLHPLALLAANVMARC